MSKSIGNTVDPKDIVTLYGADTLRIYEMFVGPFDQSVAWSTESIIGSRRFLDKVWRIREKVVTSQNSLNFSRFTLKGSDTDKNLENSASFQTLLHKTIKKITEDIEMMSFNTAISSMMILVNEMEKSTNVDEKDFKMFLQILAPFAPHITEEIWEILSAPQGLALGSKKARPSSAGSIHLSSWPKWDKKKILEDKVTIGVQVNGKVRGEILIDKDIGEEEVKKIALNNKDIMTWVKDKEIKRIIYVKGRIVNIVV
jgi:leucyl-tRNA synthetase